MADAQSEGLRLRSHVAWILAPDRAYTRFHRVAHRHSGQAHPRALAEALPMMPYSRGLLNSVPHPALMTPPARFSGPTVLKANHSVRSLAVMGWQED
jgi:hypothetical protein